MSPWALDFNLPISFDPHVAPAERWYIATGLNVAVTNFLELQGGILFKADNPRVSIGAALDLRKVSFVLNYNLDLSGRLNPLDKFSIEAKLNLGDRGRQAESKQVDELYLNGLEAYARGELERAIELWQHALAIDPGFKPAQENIDTARKALELQNRVIEETQGEAR
jgi:tetratricopeptide (TPR) repeat protein